MTGDRHDEDARIALLEERVQRIEDEMREVTEMVTEHLQVCPGGLAV